MSKLAKTLQAAAGNAGGAGELAAAIDFDGTSDNLSRSSDLTGNADGKTFTFSVWVWHGDQGAILRSQVAGTQYSGIRIYTEADGRVSFDAFNTSNSVIFVCETASYTPPTYTWVHYLLSVNLNATYNRYLYINDVLQPDTVFQVYSNQDINFTNSKWLIGCEDISNTNSRFYNGRLSNLYLDYTYRYLPIDRRLFITEDLKPAGGQAALNPILYLPLDDPEDIGYNAGTGGNFTVNGVMARSGRGPNQDNCVASYFDGSNDYMSRSSIGASDGKQLTLSCTFNRKPGSSSMPFYINNGSQASFIFYTLNGTAMLVGYNAPNSGVVLNAQLPNYFFGLDTSTSMVSFSVSIDLNNQSACKWFVNGVDVSSSATYSSLDSSKTIDFTSSAYDICKYDYWAGSLGEFYFDTNYIDLASNNPFWDSDLNKPIPIRKVLENTGNTPLIAMPIEGNNAGLNLGTGGNFTVNSGPYTGARGASEHWSKSMNKYTWVNNSTLSASTKTFSFVFAVQPPDTSARHAINWTNGRFDLCIPSTSSERFYYAAGGTSINIQHTLYMGSALRWYIYFVSVDMDDQSKTRWYVKPLDQQNTLAPSLTYSSFTTGEPVTFANFAVNMQSGSYNNYEMSSVYFTTSYIDFSQESERLKFADAFGYPLDISKQIEDGIVPTPTFYLPFDTPTNFGKNLGSGGDFTVNGAYQFNGSDVSPT
jgi:hypothetical protein